jgi:hypothetical protein
VEQRGAVIAGVAGLDQELEKLFADHDRFQGLPGAGEALAPRLTLAFGSDGNRYPDPSEIRNSPACSGHAKER